MLRQAFLLLSFGTIDIIGDMSLAHLKWASSIKTKHWDNYLSKHLFVSLNHKSMKKHFLIPRLHRASIHSKYFLVLGRKQSLMCQSYSLHSGSGTLIEPTLRLFFRSSLCTKHPSYLWWNMYLHPLLRLNLTIVSLKLREVFGNWEGNNVVVSSMDANKTFYFGGIQSNFSLYLGGTDIKFQANMRLSQNVSFTTELLVISPGIIRTMEAYHIIENTEYLSHHRIPVKGFTVITHKVTVQKFQTIRLILIMVDENIHVIHLFKGPGFLSKRFVFFDGNKKLAVASFQCLVQVTFDDPMFKWTRKQSVHFSGKNVRRRVVQMKKGSLSEHLNFQTLDVSSTTTVQSVLLFHSPTDTVVNVTVTKFVFTGGPDNLCAFGGLAIFEFAGNYPYEEFLFCNKYLTKYCVLWHIARSIFSSTPSTLLVFYIHKEYSTMRVEAVASYSPCKIAKPLNMCEKLMEETGVFTLNRMAQFGTYYDDTVVPVDSHECTIVQVSSGLYKVFQRQGPVNIHFILQDSNMFPGICHFMLYLAAPVHRNLEAVHTAHVYQECCHPIVFSIKATESVSLNGNLSIQRLPQTQEGKTERKLTSVTLLSKDFWALWKVIKQDYFATVNFIRVGALRFHTHFDYWYGSWMTYLVQVRSKKVSPLSIHLGKAVEIVFPHTMEEFGMPVSSSMGKVMWLQHEPQETSQSEVIFHFYGTQENQNGYYVTQRRWTSDKNRMTNHNKTFLLAAPGAFTDLAIFLHDNTDINQTIFHTKWISGTNTNSNVSEIQGYPPAILLFVQSGKYKFMAEGQFGPLEFTLGWIWSSGAQFCEHEGYGHLPEFVSRYQQDEFLSILKQSPDLPWIQVVFMGLSSQQGRTDR